MRNAVVSTTERDPPLGDGWAFFIEQAPYNEHIRSFVSQEDMASCSGFKVCLVYSGKAISDLDLGNIPGRFEERQGSPDNRRGWGYLLAPRRLATEWHG